MRIFLSSSRKFQRFYTSKSILNISKELETTSSLEITQKCLEKAKELNSKLNCYINITESIALEQAKESDERIKNGKKLSILDGVPISVKDVYCTKGILTTCGSKVLQNYVPPFDSTMYEKLRNSGAVLIGKTNLDEFAMGSGTTFSAFGVTQQENGKISGGSSGGAAVSLQSESCFLAIGSDTGGSVRQPASYCGLVGFKPAYGICSRYGLIPYVSSMDTVGWFTNNVTDSILVYDILKGSDERDSTCIPNQSTKKSMDLVKNEKKISDFVIGIPLEFYTNELDQKIVLKWKEWIENLKSLGAKIKYVSLPNTKNSLLAYYIIASAEASSNLSKYDGIRYGNSIGTVESLQEIYSKSRADFGDEVKRRILSGTFSLSIDEYDVLFKKAQQLRHLIYKDFQDAFESGIDVIFSPTTSDSAVSLKEFQNRSPVEKYLGDIFTVHANLSGIPAISVPIPNADFGMQIMGKESEKIFKLALNIENK